MTETNTFPPGVSVTPNKLESDCIACKEMTSSTLMDAAIDKAELEDNATWVTFAEAKELTGLQARWILEWSRVKKLPVRRNEKGETLYCKDALLKLAETKRKRRAKADPVTANDDQASPIKEADQVNMAPEVVAGRSPEIKADAPSNVHGQRDETFLGDQAATTEKASSTKPSIRLVASLRPHPVNQLIYGRQHDPRLLESVKAQGVLTPLSVTHDGLVVSGSERLWAATEAGLREVPVIVVDVTDETEILLKVLEANVARLKTNEQRVQEYRLYKEIESAKAQQRAGTRTDLGKNFSQGEAGRSRDLAAKKVGWSGPTAEKGLQVLIAIDERMQTENMQTVEEVRSTLNQKNIDAAYNRALSLGWLGVTTPAKKHKKSDVESAKTAYARVQTAAKQLGASIKPDKVAQLSPMQVQKLRQVLQPLMKWLDTLESNERGTEPLPEEVRQP